MKILIDIGHPGHVHYFKNLIIGLQDNNHQVIVTARNRGIIFSLLKKNNIKFTTTQQKHSQAHLDAQYASYEKLIRTLIRQLINIEKKIIQPMYYHFQQIYQNL